MTDSLITKTGLKTKFGLTDKDIGELEPVKETTNRYKIKVHLYSKDDGLKLAIEKYGSVEARLAEKEQKAQARNAKKAQSIPVLSIPPQPQDPEIKKRTDELEAELTKHGLELRGDSSLCQQYIYNLTNVTLEEVVTTMAEMDWFFKNTQYSRFRNEYKNDYYKKNHDYYISDDEGERIYMNHTKIISDNGKRLALKDWASKNNDLTGVPVSLHERIKARWSQKTNWSFCSKTLL